MKKKNELPKEEAFEETDTQQEVSEASVETKVSPDPAETAVAPDSAGGTNRASGNASAIKIAEISDFIEENSVAGPSENSDSPDSSDNSDSADCSDTSDNSDNSDSSRAFSDFKIIAEAFAKGRGIPEKDYSKVIEAVSTIGRGFTGEGISLDVFELLHKGMDYDRAVAAAAAEAELKGRNAAIEESVFPENTDDGLPHFIASHAAPKARRSNSIFDLAREAGL